MKGDDSGDEKFMIDSSTTLSAEVSEDESKEGMVVVTASYKIFERKNDITLDLELIIREQRIAERL